MFEESGASFLLSRQTYALSAPSPLAKKAKMDNAKPNINKSHLIQGNKLAKLVLWRGFTCTVTRTKAQKEVDCEEREKGRK